MRTHHPDVSLTVGTSGPLTSSTGSGIAETARHYAETGIPVLPCPSSGTHPMTTQEYSDATPDPIEVADDAVPVPSRIGEDE